MSGTVVWWAELCNGFKQVVKRITRVAFPPVVLVKVAWKFALHCPIHRLQLSLDLTPHTAFQNLKDQNEELARDLAEREADLQELANLVSTKDEAIKNGERRLLQVKKLIADLKAEVQSLRSSNDHREPEQQTPQQWSKAEIGLVNSHSLSSIHSRYVKVLQVIHDNCCSMANAFHPAGCPRSTVRDFVAIAELKIVDHREHDRVIMLAL